MKYNFGGFTQKANAALNYAIANAEQFGHTYIGSEHILLGLLCVDDCIAAHILKDFGVLKDDIVDFIKEIIGFGVRTNLSPDHMTPRAKKIIELSVNGTKELGTKYVGTEHILLGVLSEGDNYAIKFLSSFSVDIADLTEKILEVLGIKPNERPIQSQIKNENKIKTRDKKVSTPNLDKFGKDLTELASLGKIDPVIGREQEINRVVQILCRRTKNNPCLIGEPGVGKTAIAEGLALKISQNEAPIILKDKRIVSIDLTGMVAGTKYRGDFEERIKGIIDEVVKSDDVILFIDEVHTIIGAGSSAEGSTDAANILKPTLARGDIQVIGATTLDEYKKNIEKDSALERRFQPVLVGEPSVEDSIKILEGIKDKYEAHHRVTITREAIYAAVELSSRYVGDRYLPDKAIDLIDEACSKIRLQTNILPNDLKEIENRIEQLCIDKNNAISLQDFEKAAIIRDKENKLRDDYDVKKQNWNIDSEHNNGEVNKQDIAELISEITGIPVFDITEEEGSKLLNLESVLHEKIVGQNEAVIAVAKAIRRSRVGLKDPERPIGTFVFLGPTGVGKTELSKVLAKSLFGTESAMIRLDMSEFMEKHSVSKIIGSPPGYVGYEEGGQLTEKIRRHPYSVILLDEIEKAHSDIFNVLLQILEDGILTDSRGRKISFKNTVIIMTSNVGAKYVTDKGTALGFGTKQNDDDIIKEKILNELNNVFKPEFLNRVDDLIVFKKLSKENIYNIAEIMLKALKNRLSKMCINITFDDCCIKQISELGYDSVYGARPLRRVIQNNIEDKLSEKILDGKIVKGDNIICSFKENEISFSKI